MTGEVHVLGGGVSGLAAATRLAAAGVPVTLLEARGVLGGRATSFLDATTGEVFDNGQHALMGCYRETFAWLGEIGARDTVQVQPTLTLASIDLQGRRSLLRCPPWPAPLHLLAGVLAWKGLPWRDRAQVLRIGPVLRDASRAARDGGPLPCRDGETVAAWLARHGQGPRIRELLWEPLALAALNQEATHAAADTFVRVLGRVFGGRRTDASLALARAPLRSVFAEPARAFLDRHGARVECDALARVIVDGGRVTGLRVRETTREASRVVLATPWHTWPSTVTGDLAPIAPVIEAAARTAPSPIVTVTLAFDRRVLDTDVLGLPGRAMQWAFDASHLDGAPAGHTVALVASGAAGILRLDNDALASAALDVMREALPQAAQAGLRRSRVVREPRATFSLAPGQPRRPPTHTAVAGLWLASDWVDTGLPATIEGAAEAGRRAADAVLADLPR